MLTTARLAAATLRTRWTDFAGTFVALALGAALMAVSLTLLGTVGDALPTAPQRFAAAPAVVVPGDTVATTDRYGDRATVRVAAPAGLPPTTVARVAATGRVVADRTFAAQVVGGPADEVGHAWSVAALGRYRLVAGRPPRADGEIVVGGGGRALLGRRVRVLLPYEPGDYTVVGVTAPVAYEHAVFFTDRRAALLSPPVDALAVYGPRRAVERALAASPGTSRGPFAAPPPTLLAGAARHHADPADVSDAQAIDDAQVELGIAASCAMLVMVLVVVSTFALAIARRRTELALLRMAGATRRQLRRLLAAESAAVALLAVAVGGALGALTAPTVARLLTAHHVVPATRPALVWWAVLAAGAAGMSAAAVGVAGSAWRAGRVSPMTALREADADHTPRGWVWLRRVLGAGTMLGVVAVTGWLAFTEPAALANAKNFTPVILALVAALAPLTPAVTGRLTRPLTALRGLGGIAGRSAHTEPRRTAATAVPIAITVALAGCMLGTAATLATGDAAAARHELAAADYVVVPAGTPGLSRGVVDRVRTIPGVDALVITPTTVYTAVGGGAAVVPSAASAVDPSALATLARPHVVAGSLTALDAGSLVVTQGWPGPTAVGADVGLWLADGTHASLRVAAVVTPSADGPQVYLSPAHQGTGPATSIDVRVRPGADRAGLLAALRSATRGDGAVVTTPRVAAIAAGGDTSGAHAAILLVLALTLLYCGIAIGNTLIMTTTARRPGFVLLRLAGASVAQVLRLVAVESLLAVALGTLLGGAVTAVSLTLLGTAIHRITGVAAITVPWQDLGVAVGCCALVALITSVAPAHRVLRRTRFGGSQWRP